MANPCETATPKGLNPPRMRSPKLVQGCTPLMKLPVAGLGALVDGADGRGLAFQMSLPPKEFEATSSPAIREHMHRFRRAGDDIPRLHSEVHG
jgi:hypothetical protein